MHAAEVAAAEEPEPRLARRIAGAPAGAPRTEAEAQLYRLLAPRVRRYGQRHLRDDHAADDLMQHVMALAIEKLRANALEVAPDDEFLISRLVAPLQGVMRLDAVFALSFAPGREERLHDIPFDAASGEVLFAPKLQEVRRHPTHDLAVRLLAVDGAGERELGRYTFHHRAAR